MVVLIDQDLGGFFAPEAPFQGVWGGFSPPTNAGGCGGGAAPPQGLLVGQHVQLQNPDQSERVFKILVLKKQS